MSVSQDIVAFFMRQTPGAKFSAGDVQRQGGFQTSQNVYAQLAIMAQPGGPLMRERESGIYYYRIRPGVDLAAYRREASSPAPKPAAAQTPCRTPANSPGPAATLDGPNRGNAATSSVAKSPSPDESTPAVKPASAAAPAPAPEPTTDAPKPLSIPSFVTIDEPNPHRAEVIRFINDLRQRRQAIDEVIQLLESRFGVKS